ncbi:MAG: DUF2062 domain-containing protein [Elusimicrobiota bacterium]
MWEMKGFFYGKLVEPIKIAYQKLLRLNNTPQEIAFGFAVGAFIGVFPTFGLGGLLIIGLCYLFRLNYVGAAAGAVIIMNPLSSPLFWAISAWVGGLIFSRDAGIIIASLKNKTLFKHLDDLAVVYLTGNLIISPLSLLFPII